MTKPILLNDGERMIPEYHKGQMIYGEHIARYEAAKDLVKNKTVLDIACGTGYGSRLLASEAKKVIGIDVNQTSIDYAKRYFRSPHVVFMQGDAEKIPLEDRSVDVVVSYETVEHLPDYVKFIKEIKRVLKDNGVLLISTPNDKVYIESNRFHLHEFTFSEFITLLSKNFKNVEPLFQSTWLYNSLIGENLLKKEWSKKVKTLATIPIEPEKATYFVMICGDSKLPSVEAIGAISETWSARDLQESEQREQQLNDKVNELEERVKLLDGELHDIKASLAYRIAKRTLKNR